MYEQNPEHLKELYKAIKKNDLSTWNNFNNQLLQKSECAHLREAVLEGVNLVKANLKKVDMVRAKLGGADLKGADLRRAVLVYADLKGAHLEGADLRGTYLYKTDMREAHLEGADLRGANLQKCGLVKANLEGAVLVKADMRNACLLRAHLEGVDLREADLEEANLDEADLREANLEGANLKRAKLYKADLRNANLAGAILERTILQRANMRKANLKGADLRDALMEKAVLNSANLTNVIFEGEKGDPAYLTNATFKNVKFAKKKDSVPGTRFLELASCKDLLTVDFDNPDFLYNYINEAFEFAHDDTCKEKLKYPYFLSKVINKIKLLKSIYSEYKPPPQKLKQVVKTIITELKKYLKAHPDALNKLKPRQFKEPITEILASNGWEVVLTPSTREREYDLYAVVNANVDSDTSWIIECKKYLPENKVGINIVRALYCVEQKVITADVLLATTSNFAKRVNDFKASRYELCLKDYKDILKWINEYHPLPDGKLYIKENQLIFPEEF